jgi:hypothetical protein
MYTFIKRSTVNRKLLADTGHVVFYIFFTMNEGG